MSTNASVKSGFEGAKSMSDEFVPTVVPIETIPFDGKFRGAALLTPPDELTIQEILRDRQNQKKSDAESHPALANERYSTLGRERACLAVAETVDFDCQ